MRNLIVQILAAILLLAVVAGCGQSQEDQFLGHWYKIDGSGDMQFFEDGTVVISAAKKTSGDFKVLDEQNLRFDFGGMGALAGPLVLGYEFKDELLVLDGLNDGGTATYTRQDPGPIRMVSSQVAEGLNLSGGAKAAVSEFYMDLGRFPESNYEAGLSEASTIVGKYVVSVTVNDGIITAAFGGPGSDAHEAISGKAIVLAPEPNNGSVYWTCSSSSIEPKYLPAACR